MPAPLRALTAAALWVATLALPACTASDSGNRLTTTGGGSATDPDGMSAIVIDGSIEEWPSAVAATADEHYIYLRVSIQQTLSSIQSAQESLVAWIDLDGDPTTGLAPGSARDLRTLGVDLAIEFSPREAKGLGRGVRVTSYGSSGQARTINHSEIGLHFAPSYASNWTELRIERRPELLPLLANDGDARGVFALFDSAGELLGWSDTFTVDLPVGQAPPAREVAIPAKPDDSVRVVSWNALRDMPAKDPAPFARVLRTLSPDIVLMQEWDEPGEVIAAWFNRELPQPGNPQAWTVRDSQAWGVTVISRHPMQPLGPDALQPAGVNSPIRFVGAVVVTPVGDVATASVHLKCCGSAGSREDQTRMAEAFAINDIYRETTLTSAPGAMRIIAGDINLVGTREPLDALRSGLDENGQDMVVADAPVLGDNILATWESPGSNFSSGRLDYAIVGEHTADILNSFVLDTTRLSDASLIAAGLQRGDTAASDHNPIVVDIKPATVR